MGVLNYAKYQAKVLLLLKESSKVYMGPPLSNNYGRIQPRVRKKFVMKKSATRQSVPDKKRLIKANKQGAQGAFSRVFARQQTKVNSSKEVSNLLTHFAEEDLKRIAVMIQKWLDKDAREKVGRPENKHKR